MEPSGLREVFMRDAVWRHVRGQFTSEEVDVILASRRARRCCPPGVYLRLEEMDETLSLKLRQLVLGMR